MNDHQLLRYSRHILLDEIGTEGQQKLLDACVLVLGCGQIGQGGAAQPAAAEHQHAGIQPLLLAFGADFVEQDAAAVAPQVVGVHGGGGAGGLGGG